jgi:hypothetical protein
LHDQVPDAAQTGRDRDQYDGEEEIGSSHEPGTHRRGDYKDSNRSADRLSSSDPHQFRWTLDRNSSPHLSTPTTGANGHSTAEF